MAAQGLLSRAPCVFSSCRFLLNRLPQFTPVSSLKHKAAETLKNLNLPVKPKKPLTPYFRFCEDQRESIIKKHPDWKVTQVTVQCAADWKKLEPFVKDKYAVTFKADMEKYAIKFMEYRKSLTPEQQEAINKANEEHKKLKVAREKRRRANDLNKPKRPVGAYILFALEQAKLQPEKKMVDLMSELKDKWSSLPDGDKAKYTLPAAKAREKYQEELIQWERQMIKDGNIDVVRRSTLTGKVPKPRAKVPPLKEC